MVWEKQSRKVKLKIGVKLKKKGSRQKRWLKIMMVEISINMYC
jgi:hypothetical protein